MKRKLLSLLVLLMTAISCAWADSYLYLDDMSLTSATLKYGDVPTGKPYHDGYHGWQVISYSGNLNDFISTCKTITVDANSCQNFNGEYLSGLFEGFVELTTISGIGNLNTSSVTDMGTMFYGCGSLTTLDLSGWNTSSVKSMCLMFAECKNLTTLNISNWYTGSVEDMSNMFNNCQNLSAIIGIGSLNTSSVYYMNSMFSDCIRLTSLDLSGWNTANVIHMSGMFSGCSNLTTLNLSGWNTAYVISMSGMFNGCENLSSLNLSGWNTAKVESMDNMFSGCSNLSSLDLSGWNTAKVESMSGMFNGCENLSSLNLSGWNTAYVESMENMFNGCQKLERIYVGDGWSTASVTDNGDDMFSDCTSLPGWNSDKPVTDVSMAKTTDQGGYLTSKVLYLVVDDVDNSKATLKYGYPGDNPCFYYYGPEDVMKWSDEEFKGNVTTITVDEFCQNFNGTRLDNLFFGFWNLSTINDIENLYTANVTTMKQMFYYCESLTTLDLSDWDTSNVTNSTDMFTGCTKLSYDVTAKAGETDAYWATFYGVGTGYNFQAPSGTRVFAVDLDTSKDEISMIEITDGIIKSSEGVVLKSTSNSITLTPTITASTGNYTNNSLMGTLTEITPGENDYYVLNKKGAGIGFYKLSNTGTIGANKAYLSYNNPEGGSGNTREFIGFEEATGLKAIDNGQLTIDNVVYDLQGRRVQNPTKGLYIVNGKKVVIK